MQNGPFDGGHASRPLKETVFCAWLGQANPGDALVYHRGLLALDAGLNSQTLDSNARRELARVARRAWWVASQGLVHLVQRRNGVDDFSYIAIARPRTSEVSASLSLVLLKEIA
tara:strand:- start:340 stop:681 length:342 start_codon:yes stop_codon:yes gene_type:complete